MLVTTSVALADESALGRRPNIVLIMADDLGPGDVSHHVRTQMHKEPVVETPAIDALAKESLWFTDGHSATALCSPTRYCVMSGNNNYRSNAPWGVWGKFNQTAFKEGEVTLGTVVQDAGYSTGFIGKWHLGGDFRDMETGGIYRGNDGGRDLTGVVDSSRFVGNGPRDWGFDYDFTLPCGIQGPNYFAYENDVWYPLAKNSKIVFLNKDNAIHPKDLTSKGEGMGDSGWDAREIGKLISSKAVDFINNHASEPDPFFLYYCSPMVHVPHCPPDEFDGKKIAGATPSRHLDMLLDLDQQVKRIVDALESNGVRDNTLIVFVSDNGGLVVDRATAAAGHQTAGGYAGSKNSPLEGGHRSPFFASWKGHIKPGVTNELAVNQDLVATFAALLGTEIPEGQAQDSNNLLPLLTGEGTFHQREFFAQQAGANREVMYRKEPWKLILQTNPKRTRYEPIALYNLKENPFEKKSGDMVNDSGHQELVNQMLGEYLEIVNSKQRTVPASTHARPPVDPAARKRVGPRQTRVKRKVHPTPTWTDPTAAARESFAFNFLGEYIHDNTAIQVVPVEGRFYLSIYAGGLPGDGWDGGKIQHQWIGASEIKERLSGFTKVDRAAELDFPSPPENAIVLFDGTNTKEWPGGKIRNGLLQAGAGSKRKFRDFQLHFETMLPFKPELPLGHPDRGNSGVFALGAYEVQVCDTFGVDFAPDRWKRDGVMKHPDTWCGSIYGIRAPDINMCLPPLSWQSFDITFTAARFKDDKKSGKKISDARMTVYQNGELIHDDVALPEGTGGGPSGPRPEVPSGPLYIQNHHNPTQYRNIWLIDLTSETGRAGQGPNKQGTARGL